MNRVIWLGLVVMTIGAFGSVGCAEDDWPSYFSKLDNQGLHDRVVERLKNFVQTYPGTPATEAANAVLQNTPPAEPVEGWAESIFNFVDRALQSAPPTQANAAIRKDILLILDYPLHVNYTHNPGEENFNEKWAATVGKYFQMVESRAIQDIAASKVTEGLKIWKLYNMGFVVRSANHTVGFDIHPGNVLDAYQMTDAQLDTLVASMDALFISHIHSDHLNDAFVEKMLDAHKPVFIPTPIRMDIRGAHLIRIHQNYVNEIDCGGIKIRCFPGWQDRDVPVNVYTVNIDGFIVAQNGDNCRTDIYKTIPEFTHVDVLLANCWSGFDLFAEATNPQLMITGHENEMDHTVAHREEFRKTFDYLEKMASPPPTLILQWGEWVTWKP